MDEGYVNDPGTTLTGNINNSTTSIPVATGVGYPTTRNFRILIGSELMLVTVNAGATPDTWTATRGIEATSAASHLSGVPVNMVVTKGLVDQIRSDLIKSGPFASLPAAGNAGDLYLFEDSLYSFARDTGSNQDLYCQGKKLIPPAGFTWQNQSTASLVTTFGGEMILSAMGAAAANLNGRYVAYPSPPFTRTLAVAVRALAVNGSASPLNANGGLYISDGTAVQAFSIYGLSSMQIQFGPSMTNITTNVTAFPYYTGLLNSVVWLRMDDGVTSAGQRTFSYSWDGVNFTQILQESNTANLTPTRIGFYANAFEAGSQCQAWALGWQ